MNSNIKPLITVFSKDDKILEGNFGYAIYESEEKAAETMKYWKNGKDGVFDIRPVTLSIENGLQEHE